MENYLGKTIEQLLVAKNGGNQSEMARAVGVSPQAVQQWIAGKTVPRRAKMKQLAAYLGVELTQLQVDLDEFSTVEPDETARPIVWETRDDLPPDEDRVWMDQYDYRFSAGTGHIQWEIRKKKALPFDIGFFKALGVKPQDCRLARVYGRSMEPYLFNRDLMMICEAKTHVRDGRIYAVHFEDEPLVKQVFKEADGALRLHSYNPDFPDRIVTADQLVGLRVAGEVIYRSGSGLAGDN